VIEKKVSNDMELLKQKLNANVQDFGLKMDCTLNCAKFAEQDSNLHFPKVPTRKIGGRSIR
jgi:hypothetical protein